MKIRFLTLSKEDRRKVTFYEVKNRICGLVESFGVTSKGRILRLRTHIKI